SNKLIPALRASPILPLTTPFLRTQAQRTFGRDRFGFVGSRPSGGPKRTDGRMWIKGGATLPRRTGETRRGSETIGNNPLNNPQPEIAAISPKSRAHGAMVASYSLQPCGAFIAPAVHQQTPKPLAVGRFNAHQSEDA